ncbi:MAG: response regulator, partial [Solirubrobacteraceae bacterium]
MRRVRDSQSPSSALSARPRPAVTGVDAPLTIVIADDHAVVRDGLRMMLEAEAGFSVVGEASDLEETQALLLDRAPGVLVLDLHMGRELSLG